jgi:hypothetical protein
MRSLASGRCHRLAFLIAAAVSASLLAGGLVAPAAALASGSETWTGGGNSDSSWSNSSNWSGGVPQPGDNVTIAPTMSQVSPSVTDVPDISLHDLTLTNSSLSGGAVTVTGTFTWSVSTSQNVLNAALTVVGPANISGAGKKITMGKVTFEGNTEVSGTGLLDGVLRRRDHERGPVPDRPGVVRGRERVLH